MKQVTDELLVDGVKQFEDAMNRLLAGIEERRAAVLTGRPPTIEAHASRRAPAAGRRARQARDGRKRRPARVAPRPVAVGRPGRARDRGPARLADGLRADARARPRAARVRRGVRAEGFTDAVLLGMGGSSLGPEVIRRSFETIPDGLRLQVLDSTHPDVVLGVQDSVDLERTLFIVSSKSGGTIETLSHYRYFKQFARPNQFVVVTDPGSPLEQIAREDGLRHVLPEPARHRRALLGAVVLRARAGGADGRQHRGAAAPLPGRPSRTAPTTTPANRTPGCGSARRSGELARQGRDKLTFIVSEPIESFGLWVEQLVAESTGKHGRGILPVADEPLGEPEAYGDDRVFAYLRNADQPDARLDDAVQALGDGGASDADPRHPRRRRPRAGLLHRRVRGRGRRLGARDQSVRPAERAGGEGQHRKGARFGVDPRRSSSLRRRTACAAGRRQAAALRRDPRLPAVLGRARPGRRRAARDDPGRDRRRRPRSGTGRASSTRPGSCTRAARRPAASCSWSTSRRATPRSRAPATRSGS